MHKLTVLLAGMLLASTAAADPLDDAIALFKRQSVNLSTGVTSSDTTSSTSSDEDTSTPTTSTPTTTPTVVTESSTITQTPTTESTTIIVTTTTRTPTNSEGSVTTTDVETLSSTSTSTPDLTLITSSQVQEYTTVVTTIRDGSTMQITSTGSTVVPITTSVDPASLTGGDGSSGGSGGLSDTAKKTIGGVVGGVGGALLLAGLAYTAWRIWGKKKNLHDDDLYDPNVNQDKLSATTGSDSTPFRSTLDQYHNPGPVNTASNF